MEISTIRTGEEKINLKFKEKSFKINSNKKLNIVDKELTLINHYSADGVKRLIGMVFMTLLEVKKKLREI